MTNNIQGPQYTFFNTLGGPGERIVCSFPKADWSLDKAREIATAWNKDASEINRVNFILCEGHLTTV